MAANLSAASGSMLAGIYSRRSKPSAWKRYLMLRESTCPACGYGVGSFHSMCSFCGTPRQSDLPRSTIGLLMAFGAAWLAIYTTFI